MSAARNAALQEKYGAAYKWLAGFAVVLGLLTTIFSSTMVNVALTDIMETFHISQGLAQWMSTAFLCASCVAMLTTAWLMYNIGSRVTFIVAIAVFIIGSFLGWISPNYTILVIARILQGIGAGILQPLSMSLVFLLFPQEMRGRAMGMFGMGVVIGPAVGPVIGGIITDTLEWHMSFAVVIPLAIVAGIIGTLLLPDKANDKPLSRFNMKSLILVSLAVGCLLTGLSNSQFFDLNSLQVYPYLLIALTGFLLFFIRELKSATPLVELRMFGDKRLLSSAIIGAFTSAGMFSSFYTIPLFARTVQSATATDAGMLLLPAGLMLAVVFPIVGRLIDRMPAHRLILVGQVGFIIATIVLSWADRNTGYLMLSGWVIFGRIAIGFIMPSNSTFALSNVPAPQVPQASGALNFLRMLGGTIGVNLTAILITNRTAHHLGADDIKIHEITAQDAETLHSLTAVFHDVFLVTGAVFSISLIPAIYLVLSHRKEVKGQ